MKGKTQGLFCEKTQNSNQIQKKTSSQNKDKNSKTANTSRDELPKNVQTKPLSHWSYLRGRGVKAILGLYRGRLCTSSLFDVVSRQYEV